MTALDAAARAVREVAERRWRSGMPFRARFAGVVNGLATIRRPEEAAADGEGYAWIDPGALVVDDEVLVVPVNDKPVVVGRLVRGEGGARRTLPRRWLAGAHANPGASSLSALGSVAWTLTGTASNADASDGPWVSLATAATAGSVAAVAGPLLARRDWATADAPIEAEWVVKLSSTADVRFWIGLFSGDPSGSNTPSLSFAGFRYVAGSDADFRCYAGDGTDRSQVGTGVAPDTAAHRFRVVVATAVVYYFIDDRFVGQVSANLPQASALLAPRVSLTTLVAAAKSLRFGTGLVAAR